MSLKNIDLINNVFKLKGIEVEMWVDNENLNLAHHEMKNIIIRGCKAEKTLMELKIKT